jgi:hypothetical protein
MQHSQTPEGRAVNRGDRLRYEGELPSSSGSPIGYRSPPRERRSTSSIESTKPTPAPSRVSHGAVPNRRSPRNPSRGGIAICIPMEDTRVAQYIPTRWELFDRRVCFEGEFIRPRATADADTSAGGWMAVYFCNMVKSKLAESLGFEFSEVARQLLTAGDARAAKLPRSARRDAPAGRMTDIAQTVGRESFQPRLRRVDPAVAGNHRFSGDFQGVWQSARIDNLENDRSTYRILRG